MTVKLSEMKTFASGNGFPVHGDLIETVVDGNKYRAEYYVEDNYGRPMLMLAADSDIEQFIDGKWQIIDFSNNDDYFNEILSKITPDLDTLA